VDEIRAVQEGLGRAIERATVGEERELASEVREKGEQLANLLHGLFRMSRLYALDNHAFDSPIAEVRACLDRLCSRLGVVRLVTVEDQVYVNDVRVRFGERTGRPGELGQELKRHNTGGLTFHAAPAEAQLRTFLALFARPADTHAPRASVTRQLEQQGAAQIELSPVYRFSKASEGTGSTGHDAVEVARRAASTIEEAWKNAFAGRVLQALPLRRVVTEVLRMGIGDETLWEGLPGTPPHVEHTMRVALASLAVGKGAGLAEGLLQDLGVAALTHDLGYVAEAQLEVSAQTARLHHLARHTVVGARMMARQAGFHEAKVRRVLAALHHHRDAADARGRPTLFGRAVRLAEDFDNYARAGRGGLSPHEALLVLARGAGSRYDATLFQLLVNALGRFPPGCILQLTDGRVVKTLSLVRVPETFAKPRSRLVREASGAAPRADIVVDLAFEGQPKKLLRAIPA
jgi:hypothetical protein